MKNLFIFDVESTSLHGTGFAFGALVSTPAGEIIDSLELLSKESLTLCVDWVKENVLPSLNSMPTCETNVELRTKFYEFYMKHKDTCDIYSDVNFPVETNFLSDVVRDDLDNRQWNMPYPLLDISNFVDVNIDRAEKYQKETSNALRKHNPLDDSIASLYTFLNHKQ